MGVLEVAYVRRGFVLTNCEVAYVHEQVAKRIVNVRFTIVL